MERITTSGLYNGVLNNLQAAQAQVVQDTNETSSGMVANDLQGFGADAETVTAMQNVQSKVSSYLSDTQNTSAKLSMQNLALTQLGTDVNSISKTITDALGSSSGSTLMQSLEGVFSDVVGQLNTQYNGQYLFAGGQVNTQPVSATSLSSLTAAPSIASLFNNDQQVSSTRLDDSTTIQTGFLADQVGTPLFTALQSIKAYDQGPNGPFTDPLTAAQTTFLQSQIDVIKSAGTSITTSTSQNGLMQDQVTNTQTSLTAQQTSLQIMIGDKTNANMAQVAANLSQAQLAVSASAQVFASLKSSSLASLLPIA